MSLAYGFVTFREMTPWWLLLIVVLAEAAIPRRGRHAHECRRQMIPAGTVRPDIEPLASRTQHLQLAPRPESKLGHYRALNKGDARRPAAIQSSLWPSGEIGSHSRLKICRGQPHVGSTPTSATIYLPLKFNAKISQDGSIRLKPSLVENGSKFTHIPTQFLA